MNAEPHHRVDDLRPLRHAVARLPQAHRQLVGLRIAGLPPEEIAGLLHTTTAEVERRLARLAAQLRRALTGREAVAGLGPDELWPLVARAVVPKGPSDQEALASFRRALSRRRPGARAGDELHARTPLPPDVYWWDELWARFVARLPRLSERAWAVNRALYRTSLLLNLVAVPTLVLTRQYAVAAVSFAFGAALDLLDGCALRMATSAALPPPAGSLRDVGTTTTFARSVGGHAVDMVVITSLSVALGVEGYPHLALAGAAVAWGALLGSFVRAAAYLRVGAEVPPLFAERAARAAVVLTALVLAATVDPRFLAGAGVCAGLYGAAEVAMVALRVRRSPVVETRLATFVPGPDDQVALDRVLTFAAGCDRPQVDETPVDVPQPLRAVAEL